jgi:ureidoacrylate peracid hydrolase
MSQVLTLDAAPEAVAFDPFATAVLVIDMQNDFGSPDGMFDRAGVPIAGIGAVVPRVAGVLKASRTAGLKIVYIKMGFLPDLSDLGTADAPNRIRHLRFGVGQTVRSATGGEWRTLVRDGWGTDVVDALKPEPVDLQVWKNRYSAFYNTELDLRLKEAGIKHLIVTGCTTSVCVDSTVRDAFFRDYHCVLLADCMDEPIGHDLPRTNHEATLLGVEMLFGWTSTSEHFVKALQG